MTDLLSRPRSRPVAGRGSSTSSPRRPLLVSAVLAGAGSALAGLLVFLAVALVGWFLADAGAHGDTRDALRAGADGWLVALGSHLTYGGVDYTLVPLGLTALVAWSCYRGGLWAGRTSAPAEDREAGLAAGLFTAAFVVVAVLTGVLSATADVGGNLVRTLLGSLVVAGLAGGAGILTATERWEVVGARLPDWAWPVVRSALVAVTGLLTLSATLAVVTLLLGLSGSASMISQLGTAGGDAVMLVVLTAAVAPNAVLLSTSYLLGPGFAVGTGTSVSTGAVLLGPVPAFPLLSGLPAAGPAPWWATAFLALPPLAALAGVSLVQRRYPIHAWDLAALRGGGAGVVAGVLAGLLAALGGGALGDGRMADVGTTPLLAVAAGAVSMGIGGLIGGLLTTWSQRRALD